MPALPWSSEYSVGVHAIDSDHKLLLGLVREIEMDVEEHSDTDVVEHALNALLAYTEYHFGREEALMAAVDYPFLEQHRRVHDDMRARIAAIRADHEADPGSIRAPHILAFLTTWLHDHVLGEDQRFKPYMTGHEAILGRANDAYVAQVMEGDRNPPSPSIDFLDLDFAGDD